MWQGGLQPCVAEAGRWPPTGSRVEGRGGVEAGRHTGGMGSWSEG